MKRTLIILGLAVLCGIILMPASPLLAGPFNAPVSSSAEPGTSNWIMAKQAEFYRSFSGLIKTIRDNPSAIWGLISAAFLYGVFHAAGPGHGKAIISAYMVATHQQARRGIVISFAASLFQAGVAIAIVSIAGGLLGATSQHMKQSVNIIEIVSYTMMSALGLWLSWHKGRKLFVSPQTSVHHEDQHHHDHHHCGKGCSHVVLPQQQDSRSAWGVILSAGLRPCSGALIVLIFALAQNVYWAGIAATIAMGLGTALTVAAISTFALYMKKSALWVSEASGMGQTVAVIEFIAALCILALGILLLSGVLSSEAIGF